jgi:hypothetical protein
MCIHFCAGFRFGVTIPLALFFGFPAVGFVQAICYSTPGAAIDAAGAGTYFTPTKAGGYRVTRMHSDPVLRTKWAMVASCEHPERPAFAVAVTELDSLKLPLQMERPSLRITDGGVIVRAGDIVHLWRQESFMRIEADGISEESGDLGKSIRIKLLRGSAEDQSAPRELSGVVRGPASVEIEP